MKLIDPLMQREWLQYRFGWAITYALPVTLALLLLSVGEVEFDTDGVEGSVPPPQALAAITMVGTTGLLVMLFVLTGLVTVVGLARRDHTDRSVEFWLSLPISHTRSFVVPIVVHMVLVPLAALVLGLLTSVLVSAVLVTRFHDLQAWLALPWIDAVQLAGLLVVRVVAGWPLAVLWLLPVLLVAMLLFAWLRRWGLVVLSVVVGVASSPLGELWGLKWLPQVLGELFVGAGRSLANGGQVVIGNENAHKVIEVLAQAPAWVLQDILASVQALASPVLLGGLVVAAACFAGLVQWRRRGASVAV
jgi:ABC-2 type transport system permease protein